MSLILKSCSWQVQNLYKHKISNRIWYQLLWWIPWWFIKKRNAAHHVIPTSSWASFSSSSGYSSPQSVSSPNSSSSLPFQIKSLKTFLSILPYFFLSLFKITKKESIGYDMWQTNYFSGAPPDYKYFSTKFHWIFYQLFLYVQYDKFWCRYPKWL